MNNNVKHLQIYLFFLCVVIIFSCQQDQKPDVGHINLDIKIQRFDQDLYKGKSKDLAVVDQLLQKKYGQFYNDFITRMVGNPDLKRIQVLEELYKGSAYEDLNHEVDSVYPNLDILERDLTQTFKYIKYYYPKIKVPHFISFLSGFSYQIPIGENYMGIGLDMFLGKDSKFYPALVESIPRYQSRRFDPIYIVPRVTEEFARQELFMPRDEDRTLLSQMIYNGKILYFMDQVLPEAVSDTVKIGYTGRQLAWCQNFEGNIWGVLLENELLYKTDIHKIKMYLTDGPFTAGLGDRADSAPKLGIWIGWQIVRKYMAENPTISLQQLMTDTDAQKILTKSKYKPKIKDN
ncbi:gliding motility lipoprotein GldB [Pedobacter insulae]|uniref:Gliding motility-associated lipoprotein GldB n=1 Tax=Pedobacter insulae TaxID=414048 RepID=A0A1I2TI96_9SPHI|nr:gliding motility lipoprotein GldB [Pedobacter insulae]SFG64605.1 gliding motility-associated lipoprotein GldB [Pedobacter insulae]